MAAAPDKRPGLDLLLSDVSLSLDGGDQEGGGFGGEGSTTTPSGTPAAPTPSASGRGGLEGEGDEELRVGGSRAASASGGSVTGRLDGSGASAGAGRGGMSVVDRTTMNTTRKTVRSLWPSSSAAFYPYLSSELVGL